LLNKDKKQLVLQGRLVSKLKLALLLLCSSTLVLGSFYQRHELACEFIEYSDYAEISPNVFVGASFNFKRKGELLSIINQGRFRVNETFGQMKSTPTLVLTSNALEASHFGSNEYGRALGSLLGECVILGPKGQNVDVVAHEHVHAEVHYRVGWRNHFLKVPIWLNEGIATLVDYRKSYLLENIELSLAEAKQIKKNDFNFKISHYQASRVLANGIDKSKLYENLEKIKQGQEVGSVFAL